MALIVKIRRNIGKIPENRKAVLNHILRAKEKGFDVVVVVSAMGRLGDPYATDTLIDLIKTQGVKFARKKGFNYGLWGNYFSYDYGFIRRGSRSKGRSNDRISGGHNDHR